MATYAQVRDAIVARLETVADIGNVQDYRRTAQTFAQLEAAFTATIGGQKQIRGWSVAWESAEWRPDGVTATGQMRMAGDEVWVVRGYMSAHDAGATDRVWSALIEQTMTALATCMAALSPRQSHVPVVLRQNAFAELDVPGVGTGAVVHTAEIAVTLRNERVV